MTIREGDQPIYVHQVVHAEIAQHIADLIVRIKMGGGSGVWSELNFCLDCRARLSSLSVPAGYMHKGMLVSTQDHASFSSTLSNLPFRNPNEDLDNTYYWKSLETEQERRAFFDFTGNHFTSLHQIHGWHTTTCSPPDAMHLLYLGGMNWILQQILVGLD
jgi:hypothetical protein